MKLTSPDAIEALRVQFKNLRRMYFVFLVLAVATLAVFFVDPKLTLVLLAVSLVLNLLLGRKKSKAYVDHFIQLSAQLSLERHLENAAYSKEPVLTEAEVREARMLPCNAAQGGVLCKHGGSGSYHGCPVRLGDTTLAHSFTLDGEKKPRHNFVVGTWIIVDLGRDTGLDCRFLGQHAAPEQSVREMLWVEPDLKQQPAPQGLGTGWKVICTAENNAMPSQRFLKQLEKLHRKTDGTCAACVRGQQLHVMLPGQILAQKVSSRLAPGPNFSQADLIPSLSQALELSNFL